jgi:HAD superfamily hydrolase (TIGR01459 family)
VRFFRDLAELTGPFKAMVIDVWGVLHDGSTPYPGAVEGLRELKNSGRQVLLVSNTPSSEAVLARELADLGISPGLYDGLATSGEMTREAIAGLEEPGRRVWHIGPRDRAGLLDGLGFCLADRPERADFLLVTGLDDQRPDPSTYADIWDEAIARGLPLYCANPDLCFAAADGSLIPCAGNLARIYEERGGLVHRFGKPRIGIYERVLSQLTGLHKSETAAVGDGPATDLGGARAFGLYTVLLAGGLAAVQAGSTDPDAILALCQREGVTPDALLERFVWNAKDKPCPQ